MVHALETGRITHSGPHPAWITQWTGSEWTRSWLLNDLQDRYVD